MEMNFPQEAMFPCRTVFKNGAVMGLVNEAASDFGPRGLVIHARSLDENPLIRSLRQNAGDGVEFVCRRSGEPDLQEVDDTRSLANKLNVSWVAGIGGGSVLDLAKAVAGLFNAGHPADFYQEGGALEKKGVPFIAVPTTCGSGSEVTVNSVIINRPKQLKLSIRHKFFLARKVILDADLLSGLPDKVLIHSAMDALVQASESFVSKGATWLSDSLALRAVELINQNIFPAVEGASCYNRGELLLASYFAGLALSHSRLGVVHGIAHPLGALYGEGHGLICAVCFMPALRINKDAMGKKYEMLSAAVGMDFMERVNVLIRAFDLVSPFKGAVLSSLNREKIISETLRSGSTAANPKQIIAEDVERILEEIF